MTLNLNSFKKEAKFIAGAASIVALPKLNLPEVAFIGRSNVGKSSLINSLTNTNKLAKISSKPGHTRQINFFLIDNKFHLVDLPGYGYAKASKKMQDEWERLITHFLSSSHNLKLVNILIDARRGLLDSDKQIIELMQSYNRNLQIIITKADKKDALELEQIKLQLSEANLNLPIIQTSCKTNLGMNELKNSIINFIVNQSN